MEDSVYMLAFGVALTGLGAALFFYLVRLALYLFSKKGEREDPAYVREINGRLIRNRVETERDLI